MRILRKLLLFPLLILIFAMIVAGCSQKTPADVRIELETPDGSDVSSSIVRTYMGSSESVPQCTVCWYEEHSLLGDDYNLMTLACRKSTCELITSKEALKSLEIDGITLSTNVARLYGNLGFPGILKETEMQGFETDDSAAVTAIYMKLITEIPDPADPNKEIEEQHFYYYDLAENTLSPLSDHGYELP